MRPRSHRKVKKTASNRATQYVIYENSTYGIRPEFPKSCEFQVGENTSEYPFEIDYFYNNPNENSYSVIAFFNTTGMNINGGCFFQDNRSKYCINDKADLRFFLNGVEMNSINEHIIRNGDESLRE
jgi:hypothetical protein